ncbi:Gfo/Idh/MocA family oxidoreductase [soil metagenome]
MHQYPQKVFSRRQFIGSSLLSAAGLTLLPGLSLAAGAPGDQITLGVIGCGRRAITLTESFLKLPGVRVVAGSDVYGVKRERFEQLVNKHYAPTKKSQRAKTYEHYHDLLSRKDIDAVVIASPDHWHALMAIDACKAGKDVYLEKPLTFTIKEGQELVKAVRQHKRILAVGSQQRSMPGFQHAARLVREGRIGKIERINAHVGAPPKPFDLAPEAVPKDLNWELWLGPSPYVPFNNELNPPISLNPPTGEKIWGGWRWYKELGGGFTTDWGAHMFDIAQWALNKDSSGPVEIIPAGYQDYDYLTYRYDNGVIMTERPWDEPKSKGIKFWGSDGWIEVTRGSFRASDPALNLPEKREPSLSHEADFIEAIRSRREPVVPVEVGHRTGTVCSLGNIAYDLKRPVRWNPQTETFVSDPEAEKQLHRPYREGYKLA